MPSVIAFQPQSRGRPPFRFRATFDGANYTINVFWNVYGHRWYFSVFDNRNNRVFTLPLIGSQDCFINSSITSDTRGKVTIVTTTPHYLPLGGVVQMQIFGVTPSGYNGSFLCAVQDPVTLTYLLPLGVTLAAATVTGFCKQIVNLLGGYFNTSSMQFWDSAQEFIVLP